MKRKISTLFIMTAVLVLFLTAPLSSRSLKEHYQSGELKLVEQFRIGIDSVPEDVGLKGISGFVFTKKGDIFISDIRMHNLKMFDSQGRFIKTIGQKGSGPGDLQWPSILGYNGESIFVWENGNRRFSFFSEAGKYLNSVRQLKRLRVNKIRALKNGDIVIEHVKYNFGKNIGQECILKLYSKDLEFKKDIYRHFVLTDKFIKKGDMRVNIPQPFQPLVSWDITSSGNIVVGFQEKYEIEIYDIDKGKISSFSHPFQPVKVTEKNKKDFFDGLTFFDGSTTTKGAPKIIKDNTTFPSYKPAFMEIVVDSGDNILVFPYQEEKGKDTVYFDAFDSRGKFIKKVNVPAGKIAVSQLQFEADYLWNIIRDEEDERVLVKYKIGSK